MTSLLEAKLWEDCDTDKKATTQKQTYLCCNGHNVSERMITKLHCLLI